MRVEMVVDVEGKVVARGRTRAGGLFGTYWLDNGKRGVCFKVSTLAQKVFGYGDLRAKELLAEEEVAA